MNFYLQKLIVSKGAIDPMRMQKVAATKTREVLPPKAAGKDQFLVFRAPDLKDLSAFTNRILSLLKPITYPIQDAQIKIEEWASQCMSIV